MVTTDFGLDLVLIDSDLPQVYTDFEVPGRPPLNIGLVLRDSLP
jgi:hypothetical protein